MTSNNPDLLADLQARGLIAQVTGDGALQQHLQVSRTLYCGFDPTADSLHLGHLVPLLVLRRFQNAGHRPIALVGGATGLIGDPSFKAAERQLNTPDVVAGWTDKIRRQVSGFLDFSPSPNAALVVNNLEWTEEMKALDFLRDVGKHFSVNAMINKESVQQRLQREGSGISFTEFAYALLQGMDFAELNRRYGCTIQIGGSDQWGNIVGGIDLCRRWNNAQAYGVTVPLVTKADGTKFGKTESGAVWLDPSKTSPYAFYQFWVNSADADVYKFLRFFTFLPLEQIEDIEHEDQRREGRPEAQSILAREVTCMVHGTTGVEAAERISKALFSGQVQRLPESDLVQLQLDGLPSSKIRPETTAEMPLTTLFSECGLAKSGKQVKDALTNQAILVNGRALSWQDNMNLAQVFAREKALHGRFYVTRLGKKSYHLFERSE